MADLTAHEFVQSATAETSAKSRKVLWGATLGLRLPWRDSLDAAATAGYDLVSLSAQDLRRLDGDELRRVADHSRSVGVGVIVEGVYRWVPLDGTPLAEKAATIEEVRRQRDVLGAELMSVLALQGLAIPVGDSAEMFAEFCDRLAADGCRVMIEFSPLGSMPDIESAWNLVRVADRANGGILFDTWHFYRGTPDFSLLESLPGHKIFGVQIADAAAEIRGSLWDDTVKYRNLPGDGSLDLDRVIGTLYRIGALSCYGPEVISEEMHRLPHAEAAALTMERTDEAVARAVAALACPLSVRACGESRSDAD